MPSEFQEVPANRFFGFELVKQADGAAEVKLAIVHDYVQEGGVVHGGVIGALSDTTAVYALLSTLPPEQRMTSIEFKLNFLSPALPDKGDLMAKARVVKQGRTIGVCEADVFQKETLIATGLFTYLILAGQV